MAEFVPVIEIPIDPGAADRALLVSTLDGLAAADTRFRYRDENGTGRVVLAGIEELQLDRIIDVLTQVLGVPLSGGAPEVAFRETITRRVDVDYTHKKLLPGGGEFASIKISLAPRPVDQLTNQFEVATSALPDHCLAGSRTGVDAAFRRGVLEGFPVIGVTATILDGRYHDIDSTAEVFAVAATAAVREALVKARPVLLEPLLTVEVTAPDALIEQIIGDLKSRRGQVRERREIGDGQLTVVATVPAMNMFGYASNLRSLSSRRGSYTVKFEGYAPLTPPDDAFPPAVGMRS